jgi:CMP-N,N'-diacetyllegionaminic acid synthase
LLISGINDMNILLTIAARGGSKGVKNKNIRELYGKPLIAHTITQAKRWGKASRIVCSTDSEAIAQVARDHGAETPFMRPAELAGDTVGKMGVLRHAWHACERIYGEHYDVLIDLDPTAPMRRIDDIDGAIKMFVDGHADTVVTVVPSRRNPYFNMLEESLDGTVHLSKTLEEPVFSRQTAPKAYDMNASIYVYNREFLLNESMRTCLEGRTLAWVMDELSAFDIDTERDFILVEYLVSKGLVTL